jgi:hypothetical protein
VNRDIFLLEQVYLNKLRPNASANNTEVQSQNIPDGAKATTDYRDEAQETSTATPAVSEKPKKERAGWVETIDKTDLDKSHVNVSGFGVVTLGSLKKNVHDKFQDLAKRVMNNEPNFVYNRTKEKYGFLMHAVKALVEIEKDIEKLRRAGKMPGMLKRYNFNA